MAKFGGKQPGAGSPPLNDRVLMAHVRKVALREIRDVLDNRTDPKTISDRKWELLIKLSPSLLPKLNEHSGEGGKPIEIKSLSDEEFTKIMAAYADNDNGAEDPGVGESI